ncbi:hypothetical protein DXG01_005536 [Tephrocybe rancida]|nr:hypothetical protein DXG01_005536 [Tephrocybe rancida]
MSGDIQTMSGDVQTMGGDAQTMSDDVQTMSGDVPTMSDDAQTMRGDIPTMSGDTQTMSGDVPTMSDDAQTMPGDVPTMSGDAQTMSGDVLTMSGDAQTMSGDVLTMSGDAQTMSGDVPTRSGDVRTMGGDVQTMSGDVQTYGFPAGYFVVRNVATNRFLDVKGDQREDGTEIILWSENDTSLVEARRRPEANNQPKTLIDDAAAFLSSAISTPLSFLSGMGAAPQATPDEALTGPINLDENEVIEEDRSEEAEVDDSPDVERKVRMVVVADKHSDKATTGEKARNRRRWQVASLRRIDARTRDKQRDFITFEQVIAQLGRSGDALHGLKAGSYNIDLSESRSRVPTPVFPPTAQKGGCKFLVDAAEPRNVEARLWKALGMLKRFANVPKSGV